MTLWSATHLTSSLVYYCGSWEAPTILPIKSTYTNLGMLEIPKIASKWSNIPLYNAKKMKFIIKKFSVALSMVCPSHIGFKSLRLFIDYI